MKNYPMFDVIDDIDASGLLHLWKDTPAGYVQNWLLNQNMELYFNPQSRRVMMRSMTDTRKRLSKKRLNGYQGLW